MLGTCLVFGGSGWTGSFLVSQLIKLSQESDSNFAVVSADILQPINSLRILHQGESEFAYCDITDENCVHNLIARIKPRTIFHTASIVDLRQFPSPLLERVNVQGTLNILAAITKAKGDSVVYMIYTSSIDVVSSTEGAQGADEDTPYVENPSNHYKRTKIAAEKAVLASNNPGRLCTCALRPGHIFGPGDILLPLSKYPVALGGPEARMTFTYVENCARAHILAAQQLIGESYAQPKCALSYLAGKPVFICDFDTNFADTYRLLGGQGPVALRVPTPLAVLLVMVAETLEKLFFYVFGVQIITHPVTGVTNAMLESCGMHTAKSKYAAPLLQYKVDMSSNSASVDSARATGLVSRDEAIRRTIFYSQTGKLPDECGDIH